MAKIALLIGISDYGENLDRLPGTQEDLKAMQRVLESPDVGAFDRVDVLPNPNRTQMEVAIETLFADNRNRDDLILLYFSGHGVRDDNGALYFAASNTKKSSQGRIRTATAVSSSALQGYMRQSRSKRQVLILDCCFSGAFARDMKAKDAEEAVDVKAQLGGEGRAVLTSSTATQISYEKEGASLYTTYLVQGLETGAADKDDNGQITVDELHEYAREKVQEQAPTMQPEIYAVREGYKIFIARAPQGDPRLRYRKEAEKRARRDKFSVPAKRLLSSLRQDLGISESDAEAIESDVLKPFKEYQRKLQDYRSTIEASLAEEEKLSEETVNDLIDYRKYLALKLQDAASIEMEMLDGELNPVDRLPSPSQKSLSPPTVNCKELTECEPSKILFLKNIRDPKGGWSYTIDQIQDMGGDIESRVFEIYWRPNGRGAKSASKGDLMLLNQHAKITHVVEMLDDEIRENETGYFRWVRVVWMPDAEDWSQLPHQREILEFDPPTIGGGTAYTLANLGKLHETWDSLAAFQENVFRMLIGANYPVDEAAEDEAAEVELQSEKGIDYTHLQDLLKAGNWKEADKETAKVMLKAAGEKAEERQYLNLDEVRHFPCKDLRAIDRLWVHFSDGKFGFSVQKRIWVEVGGKLDFGKDSDAATAAYEKMSDRNGWRINGEYITYRQVTFDASAPEGHLPFRGVINSRRILWGGYRGYLLSHQGL